MQDKRLYTTGAFAIRANVSVRTIRYYDEKGLLKPSSISEAGYRYYTDSDFARLQQIIFLRKLGFTLEDIAGIALNDKDAGFVKESFELQIKLIRDKIIELKHTKQLLQEASRVISGQTEPDWSRMVSLIHLINMEETLAKQYKNSKNIDARIALHQRYSRNRQSWFRWIYDNLHLRDGMTVLETGCGNGQLWSDNLDRLSVRLQITLSDISPGMLRSAGSKLKNRADVFTYENFDFHKIPYSDDCFDLVIANHVLFYAKDRKRVISELKRVIKPGGFLFCSTYGKKHMKEIELITKEFDDRIALSDVKLDDIFGLDNGEEALSAFFPSVELLRYDDSLLVTEMRPLSEYIYSCHGNQMEYLSSRKEEFEAFLQKKIGRKGLHITKDSGMFCCRK